MLENKKIVLGITGGIAAYKACNLARLLIKKGRRRIVMIGATEKDIAAGLNRRRGAEQRTRGQQSGQEIS